MQATATRNHGLFLVILAGIVMAYGWGYRGVTGSERGAMAAGAMLGLALCLGSGREDWRRRSAVAGLFGAAGWAWGGSFSYMEQTFYTVSDSFPDVLFGYTALFLLGGLWAGIGGAVLGLAFTLPRSALERFARVFLGLAATLLVFFVLFYIFPVIGEAVRAVSRSFPNSGGNWFTALVVIVLGCAWSVLRPQERHEALVFAACAAGWMAGYLLLTLLPGKILPFPGTSLGPPYRLETWSGILGVLMVLLVYLSRQGNRAALLLAFYGVLGGGLAFSLAVFVRHPVRVEWGPFAVMGGQMQWKIAEESFGFFMGIAIALGVLRLMRGGLAPAAEDTPSRRPLDVVAGAVMLVGILWLNLRRTPIAWIERYEIFPRTPVGGLMPWMWFALGGAALAALVLYALYLYGQGRFPVTPPDAYGKGALILIVMMWVTAMSSLAQNIAGGEFLWTELSFVLLCGLATAMIFTPRLAAEPDPLADTASPADERWKVGRGYALVWGAVPVVLLAVTGLSMAMQPGAAANARTRFGADSYWREAMRVTGVWKVAGVTGSPGTEVTAGGELPFTQVEFKTDQTVSVTLADGSIDAESHGWHHADSFLWLDWQERQRGNPDAKNIQMVFESGTLYVPWPPRGEMVHYFVLERSE